MESRSSATSRLATGFFAPYIRIATHLGYALATLNAVAEDNDGSDAMRDIRADLLEAKGHLDGGYDSSPFLNESTITNLSLIKTDIETIHADEATKEEFTLKIQMLVQNLAATAAEMEFDCTGALVTEGTEI